MRRIGQILISKECYDDIWGSKPIVVGNAQIREDIRILKKEQSEKHSDCYLLIAECDKFDEISILSKDSNFLPRTDFPTYGFRAGINGIESVWKME